MKDTNSNSKRGAIKALVNRSKAYSLADYRRKVSKKMGRNFKMFDITSSLRRMAREGQLIFSIANHKVYGCLTFGEKAFQIV